MARRPDHVCCLCSKQHRHGAKTYDPVGVRCVRNCTRKPIVCRPHPWVGKSACCVCGATIPRGTLKCKNRDVCVKRSLSRLTVIRLDAGWERAEYQWVMDAQRAAAVSELPLAA